MCKKYYNELAGFNNWADTKAISWLGQINEAQWNQTNISSFGSVRQTAVHIVSAEKIWIDFWTQSPNPAYLSATFKGTKGDLIAIWKETSDNLKNFIEAFPEDNLEQPVSFIYPDGRTASMPYRQTFAHVVNHSTYHRGQLVTLLRQCGHTAFSSIDLATYYLQHTVHLPNHLHPAGAGDNSPAQGDNLNALPGE